MLFCSPRYSVEIRFEIANHDEDDEEEYMVKKYVKYGCSISNTKKVMGDFIFFIKVQN